MKMFMILLDVILFIMSGICFVFSWNKNCKDIKKAILHLLFTNTVFIFSILIICSKVLG